MLSASPSLLVPSSEEGQSTGENVWRSHSVSVDPCASRLNVRAKYPNSNPRKEIEIHLYDNVSDPFEYLLLNKRSE